MSDFVQSSLEDILKISKDVGAYELYSSINQSLQNSNFDIFNYKRVLSLTLNYDFDEFTINRFLKGFIMDELKKKVYILMVLPQIILSICKFYKINNEDVRILVVGELSKDYEYFFEQIINF